MSRNELSQIEALEAVGAKIIRFSVTPAPSSQGNKCKGDQSIASSGSLIGSLFPHFPVFFHFIISSPLPL